jgi:SHS2 domain-containing protein
MKPYEFRDHTADIIACAHGDTLEQAFANTARAMFDIITGGTEIAGVREYRLEVDSIDVEGLLVSFLSDLIVLHETENVVLNEFEIKLPGENRLVAVCRGEPFDPDKHGEGTPVKGVSYHMLEIKPGGHGKPWQVQVLFDI